MSSHSAFEKRYVDPKDKSDVEGLLEHFNLPPKVIAFLRHNKRMIQVALVVLLVVVVGSSFYSSYREKQRAKASSALAVALTEPLADQVAALKKVETDFSGTTAALWARVAQGHLAMQAKKYTEAATIYTAINKNLTKTDPLYGLTLFAKARAYEAEKKFDEAYQAFELLKDLQGYRHLGYFGMGRILEEQGKIDEALGIYGQFQTVISGEANNEQEEAVIAQRMDMLKAKK